MIDRANLIAQLAVLKKTYADTGETLEELVAHFQVALDNREVVYTKKSGKVTAFCDFSWINSVDDIEKVGRGENTSGHILHIINLVCLEPMLLWKLRSKLPYHLWITGMRDGKLHAPKGLPNNELVEV